MSGHVQPRLDYQREAGRTVARFRHEGPPRILQSLYPEGTAICHKVLVHPPGGLVGGDALEVNVSVGEGAHAPVTTPGATRICRCKGAWARQHTGVRLAASARLEWLPLVALFYDGCLAENRLSLTLDAGAELLGRDASALGLPGAAQPFLRGALRQHLEAGDFWLGRGGRVAPNRLPPYVNGSALDSTSQRR